MGALSYTLHGHRTLCGRVCAPPTNSVFKTMKIETFSSTKKSLVAKCLCELMKRVYQLLSALAGFHLFNLSACLCVRPPATRCVRVVRFCASSEARLEAGGPSGERDAFVCMGSVWPPRSSGLFGTARRFGSRWAQGSNSDVGAFYLGR